MEKCTTLRLFHASLFYVEFSSCFAPRRNNVIDVDLSEITMRKTSKKELQILVSALWKRLFNRAWSVGFVNVILKYVYPQEGCIESGSSLVKRSVTVYRMRITQRMKLSRLCRERSKKKKKMVNSNRERESKKRLSRAIFPM